MAEVERVVTIIAFTDNAVGALMAETDAREVQNAIGYLSQWCIDTGHFPKVTLFVSVKEQEITATYYRPNGDAGYVIGAVWHGEHFGFHS